MIAILFLIVNLATIEQRLESDSYRIRQQAERDCVTLWLIDPTAVDRLIYATRSTEVRQRATRARGKAIDRFLDSLGDPPWCDWPLYSPARKGWPFFRECDEQSELVPIFPEFVEKMSSEIQRWHADRYRYDYNNYRMLQREWSRQYLDRGGLRWVVELDYFLGRLVERDYLQAKAEAIERGSP